MSKHIGNVGSHDGVDAGPTGLRATRGGEDWLASHAAGAGGVAARWSRTGGLTGQRLAAEVTGAMRVRAGGVRDV
jgi:hypothetical protein